MTGGILLTLAGIWVGTQIIGGDALKRLGIISDPSADVTEQTPGGPVTTHIPTGQGIKPGVGGDLTYSGPGIVMKNGQPYSVDKNGKLTPLPTKVLG